MITLHDMPYMDPCTPNPPQYTILYKSLLDYAPALGISLDAVYLYSHLCALAGLSAARGLSDSNGHLYVICTRAQAAELLGCSIRKVSAIYRELSDSGLIRIVKKSNRANCNVAPHIYLRQWNEPSLTLTKDEIVNGQLPPLTTNNVCVITGSYYRIPSALDNEAFHNLSVRARVLYGIALDAMSLSFEYNRADINGYWCSINAADAQRLLQYGHGALSAVYKELTVSGLMCRMRIEPGCPMHTYLRPCWDMPTVQNCNPTLPDYAPQLSEAQPVIYPESAVQPSVFCPENNVIQSTCLIESYPSNLRAPARDVAVQKNVLSSLIDLPELMRDLYLALPPEDYDLATDILDLVAETISQDISASRVGIRIGSEYVSQSDLISSYAQLTRDTLLTLVYNLLPRWRTVDAKIPYLRTAIYHTLVSAPSKGSCSPPKQFSSPNFAH